MKRKTKRKQQNQPERTGVAGEPASCREESRNPRLRASLLPKRKRAPRKRRRKRPRRSPPRRKPRRKRPRNPPKKPKRKPRRRAAKRRRAVAKSQFNLLSEYTAAKPPRLFHVA